MAAKKSTGFLVVFGLVFLSVGIGMGLSSVRTLLQAQAMLAWREVPAEVLSCELKVESDSEATTYQAQASYRYEVAGARYTGDRVTLHSGSDNIGSFQQRAHARLAACKQRGEPTVCWVNPADPGESVLFRRPRPELVAFGQLFLLTFGGMGLGVALFGARLHRPRRSGDADGRQIQMRGAATHRTVAAVALAWNAYALWLLGTLWRVLKPEPVPWYLWSLAAAGALLLLFAGVLCLRYYRFGISVFELSPFPAAVGGVLGGSLRIPARVVAQRGFSLTLRCCRRQTTESCGESSTTTECCWEDVCCGAEGREEASGTVVPVRFVVPPGLPESAGESWGDKVFWRLTAVAWTWPVRYRAVFEVPVVRAETGAGCAAPAPEERCERLEPAARRLGLRYELFADGGFELACPAFRARATVAALSLFAAVFGGVCYVLWRVANAPLFVSVAFSLFEGLLVWGLLDAVTVSRGIRIDRVQRECVVWRRCLGATFLERHVPFDEVRDVVGQRATQSNTSYTYFRIVLLRKSRGSLTVMTNLKAWGDTKRAAAFLAAAAGRSVTSEEGGGGA